MDSMTFTITNIEQERTPGGATTIYFVPNDGNKYEHEFSITTSCGVEHLKKGQLRESMLEWYKRFVNRGYFDFIKVGDII
jgi:hypothetical protein